MEKKRKLPARGAAREHVAKKRTVTPPETGSATATPAPAEEQPPPPLPKSIQAGKPLPTVEDAQPEDLPMKDFQSVQESGVMAESLHRSRQKWVAEGIFEKYWSKPHKRKGVVLEEANNPAKDTMHKLSAVTIAVGPQAFEASLFAVKDPKPPPPLLPDRPILQYGPPGGAMPPPAPPTPTPGPTPPKATPPAQVPARQSSEPHAEPSRPQSASTGNDLANTSSVAAAPETKAAPSTPAAPAPTTPAPAAPTASTTAAASPAPSATGPTPAAPKPAGAKPSNTDPIIVTLAERASEDPHLRELMKKVAQADANAEELAQFQGIIDQITTEYRKKGGQQGPSADRLVVDGRTVQWFADEVRTIVELVLRSNPGERGSTLKPPERSDPLIVLLVKAALDSTRTKDIILRVANHKPTFNDAMDLKGILDGLDQQLKAQRSSASPAPAPTTPNGVTNGHTAASLPATQQTLRSKGPPPAAPKQEISAVVMEFAGGNGDRYLFPKFSILERSEDGQQIIASFLIVRKGSPDEYGLDPAVDYYQPMTVRIFSRGGRNLDAFAEAVAPAEEVRRYMDEVMDTATRAEYILLAWRLPRKDGSEEGEEPAQPQEKQTQQQPNTNGSMPKPEAAPPKASGVGGGTLWTTRPRSQSPSRGGAGKKRGASRSAEDRVVGIPSLKPKYQQPSREPSPPVFSLRKGLQGYSDGDTAQYAKMVKGLARKAPVE